MKVGFVFNRQTNKSIEQAEFDTDETIGAIHNALSSGGHEVVGVEMTSDEAWIEKLRRLRPDIVFNTAEGFQGIGRESLGPIMFEQLNIPYVGPGPYVCFLTLDKYLTKQIVAQREVPVAEGYFITHKRELGVVAKDFVYPAIVKPNYEGSSKGISRNSICHNEKELLGYGEQCLEKFPEGILVEKFIPGKDISVGYIANIGDEGVLEPFEYRAAGILDSSEWIYDYDLKNLQDEKVAAVCPADLRESIRNRIVFLMKMAVGALGIVDFGRADFRVTPDGEVFFIEFNALPSLQPGAGIFEATKVLGLSYEVTISKILEAAIKRMKLRGRSSRPSRRTVARQPKIALVYNLRRKQKHEEGFETEAEFDSPETIEAISSTIRALRYDVVPVEATKELSEQLKDHDINVVFNIAEGINVRGREAQVPALCDLLGIEYTGSDATCLSVTLDKALTKKIVASEGIRSPRSVLLLTPPRQLRFELEYPIIVKPNQEGTSKGISVDSVVTNEEELRRAIDRLWGKFPGPILIEEYVVGREFTVGVLGNTSLKVIGPMEIAFKPSGTPYPVYSLEAKMSPFPEDNETLRLDCPVVFDKKMHASILRFSRKVFRVLGCRDFARIDFRIDQRDQIQFLEINPLPGLTPGFSDMVIMAERSGVSYPQLIKCILDPAMQRYRAHARAPQLVEPELDERRNHVGEESRQALQI